jgi:hypothetical protein
MPQHRSATVHNNDRRASRFDDLAASLARAVTEVRTAGAMFRDASPPAPQPHRGLGRCGAGCSGRVSS